MADMLISIGKKRAPQEAPPEVIPQDGIAVSKAAALAIAKKLDEANIEGGVFRIGVQGGGCSGLEYRFATAEAPKENDIITEAHGVRVAVDAKSMKFIGGTWLDFESNLGGGGFKMRNPHVKSSCSCGSSFTIR